MKYCEDFAALLDLWLDGELPPEEMVRVQAHLNECPACRAYVDDALAIRASFPQAEDTPVPDGFAEGVMAAIRAQAAPRKKPRPWLKAALPLAACLALVILVRSGPLSQPKFEYTADTASSAALTAETETAVEEEAPAELAREKQASGAQSDEAPAAEMAMAPAAAAFPAPEAAKEAPALTLTADQAGDLLADFSPAEETEDALRYRLTAGEYETLLEQLAQAGIVPETPGEAGDTVVVEVLKD